MKVACYLGSPLLGCLRFRISIALRIISCSRKLWTVLAWKSSGTGRDLRKRTREQNNTERKIKDGWCGTLVGRQEEVFETQARPADRTSFSRKTDGSTLHAPASQERN